MPRPPTNVIKVTTAEGRPVHVRQRCKAQHQRCERTGETTEQPTAQKAAAWRVHVVASEMARKPLLLDALRLASRQWMVPYDQQERSDRDDQRP